MSSIGKHELGEMLKDLGAILDHFKELQALDTANVASMTAATTLST